MLVSGFMMGPKRLRSTDSGKGRQAVAAACRSPHQYHGCVIRGAAADRAHLGVIDPWYRQALKLGRSSEPWQRARQLSAWSVGRQSRRAV